MSRRQDQTMKKQEFVISRVVSPIALLSFIVLMFMLLSYMHMNVFSNHYPSTLRPYATNELKEKLIVSWTGFFSEEHFMTPSGDWFQKHCGGVSCNVTSDRRLANQSDAILFHWRDTNLKDLPRKRGNQRWILLNWESPYNLNSEILAQLGPSIDWMVTYRRDSDIWAPYGRVRLRNPDDGPIAVETENYFKKKKMAAWMVSNCQTASHREDIVKEIQKHLNVEIFGRCEGKKQFLFMTRDESYSILAKRYKFYFSFENSICRDYATEKAFQPLHHGMVPVVYGGADYTHLLPPNSYIDILDFKTILDFTKHMIEVGSNWTLYSRYLAWRQRYVLEQRDCENAFFCELCSKLNKNERSGDRPLSVWWNKTEDCANVMEMSGGRLQELKRRRDMWFGDS